MIYRALVLSAIVASSQADALAAEQGSPSAVESSLRDIADSTKRLSSSLAQLVELQRRAIGQTDVVLQFQRVQLTTMLLVEAQRTTTAVTQERDGLQEQVTMTSEAIDSMAKQAEQSADSQASKGAQESLRFQQAELDRTRERLKATQAQLAEAELAESALRDRISELEALIDSYFQRHPQ